MLKIGAAVAATVAFSAAWPAETTTFGYDALGRLISASRSGGPNKGAQATATLDAANNRASYLVSDVSSPGSVTFAASDGSATEGGAISLTIAKGGTTTQTLTMNYSTQNSSATDPTDYTASSGILTFAANETRKTVSISTVNDITLEPNETLYRNLLSASGEAIIVDAQGVGTIVDNDSINQPPVANADSMSAQQCSITTKDLTANDTNPEGDLPLTLVSISGPGSSTATIVSASSISFEAPGALQPTI